MWPLGLFQHEWVCPFDRQVNQSPEQSLKRVGLGLSLRLVRAMVLWAILAAHLPAWAPAHKRLSPQTVWGLFCPQGALVHLSLTRFP